MVNAKPTGNLRIFLMTHLLHAAQPSDKIWYQLGKPNRLTLTAVFTILDYMMTNDVIHDIIHVFPWAADC